MATKLEKIKKLRSNAPQPFGLYSATTMGLDGGMFNYFTGSTPNLNFADFSESLKKYREADYIPKKSKYTILETKGRVRLLDFSEGSTGEIILLVPSLVNKYYIFDLYEDNSFIRYLKEQNFRPYVIDWAEPGTGESLNLEKITLKYISYFSDILVNKLNQKINLLGYCMGATFCLITASKNPQYYKSLTLISPPINFTEMPFVGMLNYSYNMYQEYLKYNDVSAELIQSMFYMLDSESVIKRIKAFNEIADKKQLKRMIALEDWLADCVALDNTLVKDLLDYWYKENKIFKDYVDFANLDFPVYLITANKDKIVPPLASITLLYRGIKDIKHLAIDCGHIGIMAGRKSIEHVYKPLTDLLLKQ